MARAAESEGGVPARGPQGYENWLNALQGIPPQSATETPLYSDSHVVGEVETGWGPYQVLNTIAAAHRPGCLPVLVLRTAQHPGPGEDHRRILSADKTDTSGFHGGGIEEEISSLIGLVLNIRLRPSSRTRDIDFSTSQEQSNGEGKEKYFPTRERPRAEDPASIPFLPRRSGGRLVVPAAVHYAKVEEWLLAAYPALPPKAAVALARAARLFQHGLWLCESNANDAWLMFVSAIEVAAVEWRLGDQDPATLLRDLKPKWAEKLERAGGADLVREMGTEWVHLIGATNRFIKFILAHLPDPPAERPPIGKVDWMPKGMKSALQKVYEYRSEALHGGIPFPPAMCRPPDWLGEEHKAPTERPLGLATGGGGGIWLAEDLPMHLHTFAYIVRGVLMRWWESLRQPVNEKANEVGPRWGHGDSLRNC
jgi:hypothetical protein